MCGFAGFVGRSGVSWDAAAALAALRHRGPDGEGTLAMSTADSTFAASLVHARLAILDLSTAGRQPMGASADGPWIAYNGEVYNFREIRAELAAAGAAFQTETDTEVLLLAFERWGPEALTRFRGMFALALLTALRDCSGRPCGFRLLLARDRLGVKPLYVTESPAAPGIAFSSEVRALLNASAVAREVDPVGLAGYLLYGSVQEPRTLIAGVRSLDPGTWLEVEVGPQGVSRRTRRYWALPEPALAPAPVSREEIHALLEDAVGLRLVSDVPVAAFLSGGLDSSAIVALAARRQPIDTFSVVFDEQELDESAYSTEVARRAGARHHTVAVPHSDVVARADDALASEDQPTQDGVNAYFVSRSVAAFGIKVALSGVGGDEVFCGYPSFRAAPTLEYVQSAARFIPGTVATWLARLTGGAPERAGKLAALLQCRAPDPTLLMRRVFLADQVRELVGDGLAPSLDEALAADEPPAELERLDSLNRCSFLELTRYMRSTLLRDTDCMGMAHGLEIRTPLLDHKLVERVFALPGKAKVRRGRVKPLLADALDGALPSGVSRRSKQGFTLPFETWLRTNLRKGVEEVLGGGRTVAGGLVDRGAAARVWRSFLSGGTSWSRVWTLYALDHWIRRHIDAR